MVAGRGRELVGRADELARLRAAVERARGGSAAVVVVKGEPGVGKSRLVTELTDQLSNDGAAIAIGHGVDLAGGCLPYGVMAGLVRHLRASVGTDRMCDAAGSRIPLLGALDPTLAPPGAQPPERHALFEAVQHLILELSREQLVCLVLEDLHWADASSLDLLTYLTTTVSSTQLVVVATTRPEAASRLARLVALGELLVLRPLGDDAMRQLAANLVHPPEGAELEQIIALGQGIPLYVEELAAVQATSSSQVPAALALTFSARLAGLSQDGRHLLEAAAVGAGDIPVDLLRRVLRVKRVAVNDAVEEVVARGLVDVVDQGRVRFHHELLRRTVADALSPLARSEWHRRWALTLQRLDDSVRADPAVLAALANHWFQSGDAGQAVPAAVAAAQAASAISAATEAAVHWHRALLHWHRVSDAQEATGISHEAALVEGTTVLRLAGAYAELLEVLAAERARPTNDVVLRLWLDQGISLVSGRLGETRPQAVPRAQLHAVLDRLAAEPKRPLVRATLFWLWWDAYDADQGTVKRIIDLLDAQADPTALPSDAVGIGLRRARFALTYGDAEGALKIVQDVLGRQDALHPVNQPVVESLEVWLLFVLGRFDQCIDVGERTLTRLGSPALAGMSWAGIAENLAVAHAMAGNLDRAETLMRTVLDIGDLVANIPCACDLVALLAARGRGREADELIATLLEHDLPAPGDAGFRFGITSQVEAARAQLAARTGDLRTARHLLQPVLADPHLETDSEYLWPIVLDAARLFDDPPTLEPRDLRGWWASLVQQAAQRTHKYGGLGPTWAADVAAHLDRALERDSVEQWESVVAGWESLGAPAEAALARLRLASRLAQDSQRDRAAAEASDALAAAERLGAHLLADQARATARRHRLRIAGLGSAPDRATGLTTRELEVLALLAEGRTNDQIATNLFISPKTASVHVSRIITKLGVVNRTEAAAYAHRHGLSGPLA